MKKILIADDISTNRVLLRQTLLALDDYEIVEAVDGLDAIKLFKEEQPDLILMDIMMPGVDGCEATVEIKKLMGDDHVPIIFLTALSAEDSLSTALESGGDDFIGKPFNVDILSSKINAHLRIRELTKQLNSKNNLLSDLNQHLVNEKSLIEHFFDGAIKQSFLDADYIKYHMSSLSTFNGDLFLVARGEIGKYYVVMGDFTGHGLTAAMGTLPVAMTFFSMAKEHCSVGEIAKKINHQLYDLMPHSMFFAASILEVNAHDGVFTIWAGGMPRSYVFGKEGALKMMVHSEHMPLGILDDDEFDSLTQVFNVEPEDKIYLYSDGVVETRNSEGELFGDMRLEKALLDNSDDRLNYVLKELKSFSGTDNPKDDITLVELNCLKILEENIEQEKVLETALDWNISISLTEKDIKSQNPISKLFSILCALPFMSHYKDILHVLIFEIYNNTLDHSILNLESITKSNSEMFSEYYELREQKIKELEHASITFDFDFIKKNSSRYLKITVTDSGVGYQKYDNSIDGDALYGRGLDIINGFCEYASFSDDGKTFTVLYCL